MKKIKNITDTCREIYEKDGQSAVIDYINNIKPDIRTMMGITYRECKACACSSPTIYDECLVCGQFVDKTKKRYTEAQLQAFFNRETKVLGWSTHVTYTLRIGAATDSLKSKDTADLFEQLKNKCEKQTENGKIVYYL